jgi:hypothetical protein
MQINVPAGTGHLGTALQLLPLLLLLPHRLNTVPIPSDQHGINTEALEQLLAAGSIPR